ncbi:MAG: cytochrome c4 [Burkholderiales bacterium]|nr:cytochrome c4 [Burkholderiales bacterium]
MAASLAAGQAPPARLQACAACHGSDGNSVRPGSPSLAAQPALFLENQLVMIREGLRDVPEMREALQGITDEEIVMLARHYASLPAKPPEAGADGARVRRGAALSQRGLCGTCHLPDYRGRDQIPRLAGQREDYLLASLRLFRSGVAPGRDTIMSASLVGLSDADLADLAHYFASYGR